MLTNRIALAMGVCALMALATGCKEHKEEEEKTKFLVTSVMKMDTAVTQQYVCQIRSINHIELRAQEKGYLQKIYVDEGQSVRQGQPLFKIMPNLYQADLQKAQAEVNYAEIEYKNTARLADSNIVSVQEKAMAGAKLNKARAEAQVANVHLQFTDLRAPFNGIIDRFQVRLGSLVDEGQLLTTLSDNSEMWVYFNVPEAVYLNFKKHQRNGDSVMNVQLLMADNEVFEFPGVVKTIEADFDNETGNIAFRATFPNPKGLLRHGETGNILVRQPLIGALIVPQKATLEIMDKKYVYVVDKNNTVQLRPIVIGAEMADLYAISSGVAEGDKILLEGIRKVQNGDKIAYDYEKPEKVLEGLKLHSE